MAAALLSAEVLSQWCTLRRRNEHQGEVVLRRGRLPEARGERAKIVLIGQARQPGDDVLQVRERVLAVALAGDNQRVEDGRALVGIGVPDEQPVLLADAGRPDGVLAPGRCRAP